MAHDIGRNDFVECFRLTVVPGFQEAPDQTVFGSTVVLTRALPCGAIRLCEL
jgi:hypothetical protein